MQIVWLLSGSHTLLISDRCMDLFFFSAGSRKDVHDERLRKKTNHSLWMTRLLTRCFLLTRFLLQYVSTGCGLKK